MQKYFKSKKIKASNTLNLRIDGMSCNHCVNSIKSSLEKLPNINTIQIDLSTKLAIIDGNNLNKKDISEIIENIGYKVL